MEYSQYFPTYLLFFLRISLIWHLALIFQVIKYKYMRVNLNKITRVWIKGYIPKYITVKKKILEADITHEIYNTFHLCGIFSSCILIRYLLHLCFPNTSLPPRNVKCVTLWFLQNSYFSLIFCTLPSSNSR